MNGGRLELELRSALGTPLAADTLWGHVCWGLRYRLGEEGLADWLGRYGAGEPPLVLSDPLPSGYWPRPVLPSTARPEAAPRPEEIDRGKRLEKCAWVAHERWQEISAALEPEKLEHAVDGPGPLVEHWAEVHHAGINRLSGGTWQPSGSTLYTARAGYYERPVRFDVWFASPEPLEIVRQWFDWGLEGGYGRDASTGLGRLAVVEVVASELPAPAEANAGVLLSAAVPKRGDSGRGFFKLAVRQGRLGGMYAIDRAPAGGREKRPIRVLQRGSTIVGDGSVPALFGRVVGDVHPSMPQIRHYGLSLVLPCRLTKEMLGHRLLAVAGAGAAEAGVSEKGQGSGHEPF